ncbi:DUF2232 domain-containing protein [Desulfospira joergensenii]|uniref:DUF2232 domain-containing protein n=1 Tax=Desulfospira joergensenii TaxID=53329 RepID=UPI000525B9B5|nr:DUF2232 domain-containing protein [Desulfospira joergensenii]
MTGNSIKAPYIRDIILGICLCMVIFAIIFAFPLIGVFALIFLPLPVLFYRLKLGRNSGGIIVAVSFAALMVMTQGFGFDLLYFGVLLMTGFLIGECIERQMGIERTMILTGVGILGLGLAGLLVYSGLQGQSLGALFSDYMSQYFTMSRQVYSEMGIEEQQIQMLNSAIVFVLPGMFTISLMSTVWMNILIMKRLLEKKGIRLKNLENLNHYQAPDHLVWAVIILGILLFLPADALKYLSVNCLIVLMLVYFFQGIAIVSFFFQKKESPTALKVFCYSLIAVQLYVLLLVIGLGFFDNWINFRKLDTQK